MKRVSSLFLISITWILSCGSVSQAETAAKPAPVKILAVSFDLAKVGQNQNVKPKQAQALIDQFNAVVSAAAHPLAQNSCHCRDQYVPPSAKRKGTRAPGEVRSAVDIASAQSSPGPSQPPATARLKKYDVFVIDDESAVEANVSRLDADHRLIGASVRLDRGSAHNIFRLSGGYGRETLFPNIPALSVTEKSAVMVLSLDHPF